MRFTWGTFKYAVRDPAFSVRSSAAAPQYPNTVQSIRSAVRVYHDSGRNAARAALRGSFKSPYWKTSVGAGKAAVAFDLLDEYIRLDALDGRLVSHFDLKSEVSVGVDTVATVVDICLFGMYGFAGRIMLWDTRAFIRDDARILAAPAFEAIDSELGSGSAEDIEIWHIRSGATFRFDRAGGRGAMTAVAAVLRRAQR